MITPALHCPYCQGTDIVHQGGVMQFGHRCNQGISQRETVKGLQFSGLKHYFFIRINPNYWPRFDQSNELCRVIFSLFEQRDVSQFHQADRADFNLACIGASAVEDVLDFISACLLIGQRENG
jgi:hypothetical protein